MNLSKRDLWDWWLSLYAIGLVFFPPFRFGQKSIFASELLLIPVVLAFAHKLLKGKVGAVPRKLLVVWIALFTALISGMWRHDLGIQLSAYYQLTDDVFKFSTDVIRFLRWLIILSTPWLVSIAISGNKRERLAWLMDSLTIATGASAFLVVLDHFSLVSLNAIYHREYIDLRYKSPWWMDRSWGTFVSPQEASLMYGGLLIYSVTKKIKRPIDFIFSLVFALALAFTKGATAFISAAVAMSVVNRQMLVAVLVGSVLAVVTKPRFFVIKCGDFAYRHQTWFKWLGAIPTHPWIAVTGLGFTGLVVDNSFVLTLVLGGIFLFYSVAGWIAALWKLTPTEIRGLFVFWFISWLALDSIGYWGIGRLCWLLWGFCL